VKCFNVKASLKDSIGFGIKIFSAVLIMLFAITGCGDNDDITDVVKHPPTTPSEPYPANGATDLSLDLKITWLCSDIDLDTLVYDLYFGNESDPPLFSAQQKTYSYRFYSYDTSYALELDTTYYWKVIAKERVISKIDSNRVYDVEDDDSIWVYVTDTTWGESAESEIWNFSTSRLYLDTLHMIYDTGNGSTPGNVNKVFVESDNNSLIYIADDNFGLRVVNVVDTIILLGGTDSITVKTIHQIGAFDGNIANYTVRDITVSGDRAYLSGPGVIIIDVTNPASMIDTYHDAQSYYDPTPSGEDDIFYASAVNDGNSYVFTVNGDSLFAIDIGTDESDPTVVGTWPTPGTAYDIYLSGDYVYIADADSGLQIVDISTPENPTLAGNYSYTAADSVMGVFVDGNTAYLAYGKVGLVMVDITDPTQPAIIGSPITLPGENETGFAKDVHVHGGYAFIAAYFNGGLQVVDIAEASVVASYNTKGGASGVFANDDYVYLADRWPGLLLFEFK